MDRDPCGRSAGDATGVASASDASTDGALEPVDGSADAHVERVLLFHCMQERVPETLLASLATTLAEVRRNSEQGCVCCAVLVCSHHTPVLHVHPLSNHQQSMRR